MDFMADLPVKSAPQGDLELSDIRHALLSVYYWLSRGDRDVSLETLTVGLTILCRGSKSSKLAYGFTLLDEDGKGRLPVDSLASYFESYMLGLLSLSVSSSNFNFKKACVAIRYTARQLAEQVIEGSAEDVIDADFPAFGDWYNTGGFTTAPWLELIDLSKWGAHPRPLDSSSKHVPVDVISKNGYQDWSARDKTSQPKKQFQPSCPVVLFDSEGGKIEINVPMDSDTRLAALRDLLGLGKVSPQLLAEEVDERSREEGAERGCIDDGLLSIAGFEALFQDLAENAKYEATKSIGDTAAHAGVISLLQMFLLFDRTDANLVDVDELIVAMSLLCKGSKSVKLAFAFDFLASSGVVDDDGQDIFLADRRVLFRLFRSFLAGALVLGGCRDVSVSSMSDMTSAELRQTIDITALAAADSLLSYTSKVAFEVPSMSVTATFDDLSTWYSGPGCLTCQWLELLDLGKWTHFVEVSQRVD